MEINLRGFIVIIVCGSLGWWHLSLSAVGDERFEVIEETRFPATTPIETLDKTGVVFSVLVMVTPLLKDLLGPVDPNSKTYGYRRHKPH